ncbi:MAG: sterol desaturase family protein [Rhizobacter sp.]|nr:sterol desaturase family protein [Ferruginibacter sp.]
MNEQFWKSYLLHNIVQFGRYFVFAGLAYLVFYILFKNKWIDKKIQKRFPDNQQIKREIRDSLVSIFIFSLVFIIIVAASKAGYTKLYKDFSYISKWYFWFSIPLLIFWHDTWFYWTHRLMHHPKIFKIVHRQHHLSHNPTPWTAFAFHPIEAFAEAGFVFIVFLVPVHPVCLLIVITWQMLFNVYGHMGYELMSKWVHHSWIGRLFNTSTHHNMHHRLTKGNYGLYFNFWDTIMHTNHPDYENQYHKNAQTK